MSCAWNCRCRRCSVALKNDLAVSFGDVDPPSPAEEAYAEANWHTDSVVIPAVEAA